MAAQVNPQEVYLLERYTSLDYFGELRDTWSEMVEHVESCLESFMRDLPPHYRSRPLPEQPDVVWGRRILPNFRDTLRGLDTGYIQLAHGDVKGLAWAYGPESDFKGQQDYWPEWMPEEDHNLYHSLLIRATTMASNITKTEGAYWRPLTLSHYSEQRGPLNPPDRWPAYRVNKNVSVRTGAKTRQSGVYVPDVDNSCAEFLSTSYEEAPQAFVLSGLKDLLHPTTGEKYGEDPTFEKRSCIWYLVERTADAGTDFQPQSENALQPQRIPAGDSCPETGFYFTPARPDSRRLFQKGDMMPAFDTAYGATIWQWDTEQQE
jgi:hypothetical protein